MLGATQHLYYTRNLIFLSRGSVFMGWRSVIITQHSKLSYSSRMMVVQNNEGINQIPVEDIELLVIETTQAVITSSLIGALTKNGTKVIFTDRQHEPVCETVGYYPNNLALENINLQYNWSQERMELLWTNIVIGKIENQIQVLRLNGQQTKELEDELDVLEVNDVTNREAVVAKKYFQTLFTKDFSRRTGSVINKALDYGYAVILSKINREIVQNGFLTYLGIHHHSNENQFNFGCDLIEPFRPIVDYWVNGQNFLDFTPDVKYGLVYMLNLEIKYNGKNTLLRNAITKYVSDCLNYLNGKKDNIKIEVTLPNEVSYNALNDHV